MSIQRQSMSPVPICDPQGIVLGTVDPKLTPEFIGEMKRRAAKPGPKYTHDQVKKGLEALEDAWEKEGLFDVKRAREFIGSSLG